MKIAASRARFPRIAAALLALVFVAATCAMALVANGHVNELEVAAVEQTIQTLRGLELRHKVRIVARTPDQVGKMLKAELDREYTPKQIDTDGRAGALLGLYPPGTDLRAENLRLLKNQVIAFYDFHERKMVVVEGAFTQDGPNVSRQTEQLKTKMGYMILAHEFTHALQDQNYDLGAIDKKLRDNGDRELALHSVAEGDATIAGYAYMLGGMNQAILNLLVGNLGNFAKAFIGQAGDVPIGVSEPMIFQYTKGVNFVAEAWRRGGWKAVDRLYSNPPESTQQIINPSLYYNHPTLPDTVKIGGYEAQMAGWHKGDEDTLGELGLEIILENTLPKNSPNLNIAHQWAGDRIVMMRKGDDVGVIWLVAFRSLGGAQRFGHVYQGALDRLHRKRIAHHVQVKEKAALVAIGEPAERFQTLAPSVWKASSITAPVPPSKNPPLQANTHPAGSGTLAAAP